MWRPPTMSLLKRLGTTPDDDTTSSASSAPAAPPARTTTRLGSADGSGGSTPPRGGTSDLSALRRPTINTPGNATPRADSFNELKSRVQNRLISELDPRMDLANHEEVRRTVEETFQSVLEAENIVLTRVERLRLYEAISAEILGYGPIEPLLKDDS